MNFKKILFLFLALLLPIVVFLFLKSFGKNEFAVEPLFQTEIERKSDCPSHYEIPYVVSDSALTKLAWTENDSLTLIIFGALNDKKTAVQENRLKAELPKGIKLISALRTMNQNCVFLLKPDQNAVLLDSKRRIRGQYDLTNLDEADRLIMEANIILKKY
jgi:hypothetical protein